MAEVEVSPDRIIDSAIRAKKIPESQRAFYTRMFREDPYETAAIIRSLRGETRMGEKPKPAPVAAARPAAPAGDSYDTSLLSHGERARLAAAQAGHAPGIVRGG